MAVFGTIICLGDSLTHGARDDYGRCYPMELSDMLWSKYGQRWLCAEEGVNGEISSDILRRSLSVMKKYPEAHEVILLCGTNDSKDRVNMSSYVFNQNMEGILRVAAAHNKEVLICSIPDLIGFGAPDYSKESQKRIDIFNKVIVALVTENPHIIKGYIDLRGIHKDHYADGVHFKNSGYKEIAGKVLDGLIKKREFVNPEVKDTSYNGFGIESHEDEVTSLDIVVALFSQLNKNGIPKNHGLIHKAFYELKNIPEYKDFLEAFTFNISGIIPYSELLESTLNRLKTFDILTTHGLFHNTYKVDYDFAAFTYDKLLSFEKYLVDKISKDFEKLINKRCTKNENL